MPTPTFFNLPTEKKERILEAATQEFAAYPFDQASISRIIEQAGIPRGSFYQYFENLKDLYKYIITLAIEKKLQYFEDKVPDLHGDGFDFFATLDRLFKVSLQFAREHPQLLALGDRFIKESNLQLRQEVMAEQTSKSHNFYNEMLKKGFEAGQLDNSVDFTAALLYMNGMNFVLIDAYHALNSGANNTFDEKAYGDMMDKILYLMANGLKNRR